MTDSNVSALSGFVLERILSEDAHTRTASLLGHFLNASPGECAILNLEKTHFSPQFYQHIGGETSSAARGSTDEAAPFKSTTNTTSSLVSLSALGTNDVYTWLLGWMPEADVSRSEEAAPDSTETPSSRGALDAHVKLTLIRPASEAHILKYSQQSRVMVRETPSLYRDVIQPYIYGQPAERTQWVYNILDKKKEADTILFEDPDPRTGFIVLPDLKWDRTTLSSLYLVAIVHDRSLRSMRDLTRQHIPLLRNIGRQAGQIARARFGLACDGQEDGETPLLGKLRCFLHYQPTYYHLHVHILSSDFVSHPGAIVGQAHLLDDVIDLLEQGVDMRQRTLSYALGSRSPLLSLLTEYQGGPDGRPSKATKLDAK